MTTPLECAISFALCRFFEVRFCDLEGELVVVVLETPDRYVRASFTSSESTKAGVGQKSPSVDLWRESLDNWTILRGGMSSVMILER